MIIAYHFPFPETLNAWRTVYNGYKHAFEDKGHDFHTFSGGEGIEKFLTRTKPDIFITSSHYFWRKQLDYEVIKKFRDSGMVVFVKIDFWSSPMNNNRINEAKSMKDDHKLVEMIKSGEIGDIFFHTVEQDDDRMAGFTKFTNKSFFTLPLAADKLSLVEKFDDKFKADISFIGTNLPQKREYFKKWLFPLKQKYDLKLYGQDWTQIDRILGYTQKIGQFFDIGFLKNIRKPKLDITDEAKIYSSTKISVNLHEDFQRKYGGDCNERTFKILACNGFEITDDVSCISRYFEEDKEIVIAHSKKEWFDKIEYYMKNEDERKKIAANGRLKVLRSHTYHNRVDTIVEQYDSFMEL